MPVVCSMPSPTSRRQCCPAKCGIYSCLSTHLFGCAEEMQICVHVCRSDAGPLLEVELELVTPDMVWKPELGGSEKGTVQGLVERWLTSFLEVSGIKAAKVVCTCAPLPEAVLFVAKLTCEATMQA